MFALFLSILKELNHFRKKRLSFHCIVKKKDSGPVLLTSFTIQIDRGCEADFRSARWATQGQKSVFVSATPATGEKKTAFTINDVKAEIYNVTLRF